MQFKPLKALILASTAIAGLSFMATDAKAANPETVLASVEQVAAITVANVDNISFGRWLFDFQNAENIVLTLNPDTGVVTFPALTDSSAVQLNSGNAGHLTVTLPAGINNYVLDMIVSTITDFTEGGVGAYSLSALRYSTLTEASAAITADGVATHPVTVITGNVAETVNFGATLTVGAQPTTGVADDASFTVTFNY